MQSNIKDLIIRNLDSATKEEAKMIGSEFALKKINEGKEDLFAILSKIIRMKEALDSAEKELLQGINISGKSHEAYGISYSERNGAERLQYSEDEVISELSATIKERKELVKMATKSKKEVFDEEGIQVNPVSSKFDKNSIIIKW